jgi:hypothetical protein
MYPATIVNFGHSIDVAVDIAMNYLERTGQATAYWDTHSTATSAILTAWRGEFATTSDWRISPSRLLNSLNGKFSKTCLSVRLRYFKT